MDISNLEKIVEKRTKIIKMMMMQNSPEIVAQMDPEAMEGLTSMISMIMGSWTIYENMQKIGQAFEEDGQ